MKLRNQVWAIGTAAMIALAFASPAYAHETSEDALRSCPELGNTYVQATLNNNYHIGFGPVLRSGPGGAVTASGGIDATVSLTMNVSGTIGVNEIVQATQNAGFSGAASISSKHSYAFSHDITPGRYGNIQFGNYGKQVSVKKTTVVSPCTFRIIASGTAIVPSRDTWGYKYWES